MGSLTNLQEFLAQFNALEGPIPAGFFGISNVSILRLDNNNIDGTIDEAIGDLSALTDLRLNNNTFSGPFPDTIQSAKGLGKCCSALLLFFAHFAYSLTMRILSIVTTVFFLLANNTFDGDFPNVFNGFSDLEFFDITNNGFTGGFPDSIFDSPDSLTIVYVRDNAFTGPLPASYATASKMRDFYVNGNLLTGSVPPITEGQLPELNEFLLQDNDFTGVMPDTVCALRTSGMLEDLWSDCRPPAEIECPLPECCTRCFPEP
jgi:hypothetical protein